MRLKYHLIIIVIFVLIITINLANPIQANNPRQKTLFQTSTIEALVAGIYDGTVSFKELKQHGNFGLGTVNR